MIDGIKNEVFVARVILAAFILILLMPFTEALRYSVSAYEIFSPIRLGLTAPDAILKTFIVGKVLRLI